MREGQLHHQVSQRGGGRASLPRPQQRPDGSADVAGASGENSWQAGSQRGWRTL